VDDHMIILTCIHYFTNIDNKYIFALLV